jgi:hypothetical protein
VPRPASGRIHAYSVARRRFAAKWATMAVTPEEA